MCQKASRITGGLMHSMYKVTLDECSLAVKVLNPEVMKRPCAYTNITKAEKFGITMAKDLPAVTAILDGENVIRTHEGKFYIIYPWHEGTSIFPPDIERKHCEVMGEQLGKLHQFANKDHDLPAFSMAAPFPWTDYLKAGKDSNAPWTELLERHIALLEEWNQAVLHASEKLHCDQIISHRDLDPKNVMWHEGSPLLIDWEASGYVHPHKELLEMLTYWASDGQGGINADYVSAMVHAYEQHAPLEDVDWSLIQASGYEGMLGWLNYSFKRSLGLEASDQEEMDLGCKEVFSTITQLMHYHKNAHDLLACLL